MRRMTADGAPHPRRERSSTDFVGKRKRLRKVLNSSFLGCLSAADGDECSCRRRLLRPRKPPRKIPLARLRPRPWLPSCVPCASELSEAQKPVKDTSKLRKETVSAEAADELETKRFGFKSFGEFTRSVQQAGMRNGQIDNRLLKAVSGLSEGTAADGGFLVPPEFAMNIWAHVYSNDLLSKTQRFTCSGNTMVFPAIDETSRVDGSRFGGILSYWMDEAGQLTGVKPKFRRMNMTLHKLACLAFATEELLNDAMVALDQYLFNLFAMEMEFRIGDSLINGDGVGKPLGLLNAPALVTVAAEAGQPAATILTENIVKMWRACRRLPRRALSGSSTRTPSPACRL